MRPGESTTGAVTLHRLFAAQAARRGEAVALVFEGEQLTYAELDRRSNQLAHHLLSLGVSPDSLVAVCLDRSVELFVALLGISEGWRRLSAARPVIPAGTALVHAGRCRLAAAADYRGAGR